MKTALTLSLILILALLSQAIKAQTCNGISINSLTATPATVCAGQQTALSATLGATYQVTFSGSSGATMPPEQNATPFPITLTVLGLPTTGVTVASIQLEGLTHDTPANLDIYAQSPTTTNVTLMSDIPSNGISNINITLQDGAAIFPSPITSGTYLPTNTSDANPGDPPGGAGSLLSGFNGNPNGTWGLFIENDAGSGSGSLSGWKITFNVPTSSGLSYQWASNNTTSINNANTATPTSSPTTNTTYTVTVTGIGGCTATANTNVIATPIPTVTDPADQTLCAGQSTNAVTFSGTATTYNWTNSNTTIGLAANGSGNIAPFSATNATASAITATITVTPTTGACSGTPQTFSITVNPNPTASISVSESSNATPNGNLCNGESVTLIASGGITYNWSNSGGTNSFISDVTTAPSETYTVTVTGIGGCTVIASQTINVNNIPPLSISPTSPVVCIGSSITLTASGANSYIWAASGGGNIVSGGTTSTPSINAAGSYSVTATTNGCSATSAVVATATSAPSAGTAAAALSVCNNSSTPVSLFSLLNGAQLGGTWSVASGSPLSGTFSASSGTFTPTGNSVGTFTFTYTVTGGAGCTGSDSETVTVILTGAVSAGTAAAPLSACVNSTTSINLSNLLTGETSGGVWTVSSGTPASGTFSSGAGTFTPNGNVVGNFTFTYTVTGSGGCPGSDSETVTVQLTSAPSAGTAQAALSVCNNSSTPVSLFSLLNGAQLGGTWSVASGSPASGTFSAVNGTFTPNGNSVGTFTFTYTVTGGAGCTGSDSETVTVILTGAVSAGTAVAPLSACVNGIIAINLETLLENETIGGVWTLSSGSPASGTFDGVAGTFTPSGNAEGTFTFTYTVTGGIGCPGTLSETVTVILTGAPSAGTAQPPQSVCNNSITNVSLFALLSGAQLGGTWAVASGSPALGTFSSTTGTFTPNGNSVGTFTFTYTVTGGAGCTGSDSETVTVILTGAVSAGTAAAPLSACVNSIIVINLETLLENETIGGVWSVASGIPASGTFDGVAGTFTPNGNAEGTFTFTYMVTGGIGCPGTLSETVTVQLIAAPYAGTADTIPTLCGTRTDPYQLFTLLSESEAQSGGTWTVASGAPVAGTFNAGNGTFTPNGNSAGTYVFTYTINGIGACSGTTSSTNAMLLTSFDADTCDDCPPAPSIILKSGSDVNPNLPVLICTTPSDTVTAYSWGAYILDTNTGGQDTILTALLGNSSQQYYVRDICAERRWLAGDMDINSVACPTLDTLGKQLIYFVVLDYISQFDDCANTAIYAAKWTDLNPVPELMGWVSPNPSSGDMVFRLQNDLQGEVVIDIYDLSGKSVQQILTQKQGAWFEQVINLNHVPQGMYVLKVTIGKQQALISKVAVLR